MNENMKTIKSKRDGSNATRGTSFGSRMPNSYSIMENGQDIGTVIQMKDPQFNGTTTCWLVCLAGSELNGKTFQALKAARAAILKSVAAGADSIGMNENDNGQRRAKAGGELGANGEWYEGGKFIATQQDSIKAAPVRHEVSAEERARWAAWKAEAEAATARRNAWIAARCEQFRYILGALEADATDQWGNALPAAPGSFLQSLAQQLRANCSLSHKQAGYAVKATLGRRNKKNAAAWDAALAALVEEFAEAAG